MTLTEPTDSQPVQQQRHPIRTSPTGISCSRVGQPVLAARRRHKPNRWPGDTDDEQLDESILVIVQQWTFDDAGWLKNGAAALAASAAAREHRDLARQAQDTDQDHEL
jgi:hypothetical protein